MHGKSSKFKAILSFVLVLLLLAGCGAAGENGGTATSAAEGTAAGNSTAAQLSKEPKVTISIIANNGVGHIGGPDITDPVILELARATGVTAKITFIPSQDDIKAKTSAMVASGDLPDVVWFNSSDAIYAGKQLTNFINADAIVDLTELIETNGQNFLNDPRTRFAVEYNKKFLSNGTNKLYFIGTYAGPQSRYGDPLVGPYIRWDYYKELGYPAVNDADQLLDVLEQMQNKYPTALNGKKAYGTSFFVDWGMEATGELMMVDGIYDRADITNHQLLPPPYTDASSNWWKWIKWLYNAKQRGILDPDSFTLKYDQWEQKVKGGETYFFTEGWVANSLAGEEGQGYAPVDYQPGKPTDANFGHARGASLWAITTNCKNPDRALDFFNYCASEEGMMTIFNGVKGETWDVVDGVPTLKPEVIEESKKRGDDNKMKEKYGMGVYEHLAALTGNEINPAYNMTYQISQSADYIAKNMNAVQKDFCRHYGVKTTGDLFAKREFNGYLNPVGGSMPSPEGDVKLISDKMNEYMLSNWLKPILAKNDADFEAIQDKIIKDLFDMGAQQTYDWYEDNWNKLLPQVRELEKAILGK